MTEERIEVIAYAGSRGEETPRAMIFGGKKVGVAEIQKMWVEEGVEDRSRKRFFKVKGNDGKVYELFYDETVIEWFCRV